MITTEPVWNTPLAVCDEITRGDFRSNHLLLHLFLKHAAVEVFLVVRNAVIKMSGTHHILDLCKHCNTSHRSQQRTVGVSSTVNTVTLHCPLQAIAVTYFQIILSRKEKNPLTLQKHEFPTFDVRFT